MPPLTSESDVNRISLWVIKPCLLTPCRFRLIFFFNLQYRYPRWVLSNSKCRDLHLLLFFLSSIFLSNFSVFFLGQLAAQLSFPLFFHHFLLFSLSSLLFLPQQAVELHPRIWVFKFQTKFELKLGLLFGICWSCVGNQQYSNFGRLIGETEIEQTWKALTTEFEGVGGAAAAREAASHRAGVKVRRPWERPRTVPRKLLRAAHGVGLVAWPSSTAREGVLVEPLRPRRGQLEPLRPRRG